MRDPGDQPVPNHTLIRKLGEGTFGEVWEAEGPGGTRKALKFIPYGRNLLREYRAIRSMVNVRSTFLMQISDLWLLDDRGTVLDSAAHHGLERRTRGASVDATATLVLGDVTPDVTPAHLVIAMDLGDCSLGDLLREHQEKDQPGIPQRELLRYMEDAARGIDYLNEARHDLGEDKLLAIRHCDIKPDNIMLQGGGAKICDFGLARLADDPDHARKTRTASAGSPAYMAPECLDAKKGPTSTTDQYSLAITYFELLTDDLPFADEDKCSTAAIFVAKQEGRLDFSKLPERQRKVLEQATSIEPNERFVTAGQMVAALKEAVEPPPDLDIAPTPPSATRFIWPTVAAFAVIGALVAAIMLRPPPDRQFKRWIAAGKYDSAYGQLSELPENSRSTYRKDLVERWEKRAWDQWPSDNGRDLDDLLEKIVADPEAIEPCRDVLGSLVNRINDMLAAEHSNSALRQSRQLIDIATALRMVDSQNQLNDVNARVNLAEFRIRVREEAEQARAITWDEKVPEIEKLAKESDHWNKLEKANFLALRIVVDQQDEQKSATHIDDLNGLSDGLSTPKDAIAPWENGQSKQALKESPWWWSDSGQIKYEAIITRIWGPILPIDVVDKQIEKAQVLRRQGEYPKGRKVLNWARELDKAKGREADIHEAELMLDLAEGEEKALELISSEPPNYSLLHSVCKRIRADGSAPALVDACWVESGLHLRLADANPISLEDWSEFDETINEAVTQAESRVANSAAAKWIWSYAKFVEASTDYRRPSASNPEIWSAAERMASLYPAEGTPPSPPLDTASRRKMAVEVLFSALRALGPRDTSFTPRRFFRDAESRYDARIWLHSAARLASDSSPILDAYRIISAAYPTDRESEVEWVEIQRIASNLITDSSTKERLAKSDVDVLGLVYLVHAKSLGQTAPNAHLAIIESYEKAYSLLENDGSNEDSPTESIERRSLYEELLHPVCELASQLIRKNSVAVIPSGQRQELAKLFFSSGNYILNNEGDISDLIGGDTDPTSIAYDRFEIASQLHKTSATLVKQGLALIEMEKKPAAWQKKLRDLASGAEKLAPNDAGPNYLLGFAIIVDAREAPRVSRRGMFEEAVTFYTTARDHSEESAEKARALVGLSTANLEQAFHDVRNRDTLIRTAEMHAREAVKINNRNYPEHALIALGNALEDRSYYLKEVEYYDEAINAFREARAFSRRRGRTGGYASLCAGRCILRKALSRKSTPEFQQLLSEAKEELKTAVYDVSEPSWKAEAYHWCSFIFEGQDNLKDAERSSGLSVSTSKESVTDWPIYQLRWARLAELRGRHEDTVRRAGEILTATRPVASNELYEAVTLTLDSLALEDQFQMVREYRNKFPNDGSAGTEYLIQLLCHPCQKVLEQEGNSLWVKHKTDCQAFLTAAHGMSLELKDLDRRETIRIQSLCDYLLGGVYLKEERWSTAANSLENSVRLQTEVLETKVLSALADLADPSTNRVEVRRRLSNRELELLDEHLVETAAARTFLGMALANLARGAEASKQMRRALNALRPLEKTHFKGTDVLSYYEPVVQLVNAYERKLQRSSSEEPVGPN